MIVWVLVLDDYCLTIVKSPADTFGERLHRCCCFLLVADGSWLPTFSQRSTSCTKIRVHTILSLSGNKDAVIHLDYLQSVHDPLLFENCILWTNNWSMSTRERSLYRIQNNLLKVGTPVMTWRILIFLTNLVFLIWDCGMSRGFLLIAEVKSRFDPANDGASPTQFVDALKRLGFALVSQVWFLQTAIGLGKLLMAVACRLLLVLIGINAIGDRTCGSFLLVLTERWLILVPIQNLHTKTTCF